MRLYRPFLSIVPKSLIHQDQILRAISKYVRQEVSLTLREQGSDKKEDKKIVETQLGKLGNDIHARSLSFPVFTEAELSDALDISLLDTQVYLSALQDEGMVVLKKDYYVELPLGGTKKMDAYSISPRGVAHIKEGGFSNAYIEQGIKTVATVCGFLLTFSVSLLAVYYAYRSVESGGTTNKLYEDNRVLSRKVDSLQDLLYQSRIPVPVKADTLK